MFAGERRIAVPGSAQIGTRGLDNGGVENVRVWSARKILFAYAARAATARKRSRQLGQAFERHFAPLSN